jgi:hypothetical protein
MKNQFSPESMIELWNHFEYMHDAYIYNLFIDFWHINSENNRLVINMQAKDIGEKEFVKLTLEFTNIIRFAIRKTSNSTISDYPPIIRLAHYGIEDEVYYFNFHILDAKNIDPSLYVSDSYMKEGVFIVVAREGSWAISELEPLTP